MKKFDLTLLTLSILLLGLVLLGFSQQPDAEPIAKVNGTVISKDAFYDALRDKSGPQVLQKMINDQLIKEEAQKQGVAVSDDEVNRELESLKKQAGSDEKFNAYLKMNHLSMESLKQKVYMSMLVDKLLEKAFPITEDEMKAYYDKHKDKLGKDYDQAKPQVKKLLIAEKKRKELPKWLDNLKKNAKIETSDSELAAVR